jgi:hypothetical protein
VIAGGVLYGTTNLGGSVLCNAGGAFGCGTVFSLTPPASPSGAWTEAVLHNFAGGSTDGATPYRRVAIGEGGVLYGTTYTGGSGPCIDPGSSIFGCGTVYSLSPPAAPGSAWTESVLHNFAGSHGDGVACLFHRTGHESTHGVFLPSHRLHDFRQRGAVRAA